MAGRIKVINEPGDLVSIFRAADTDIKRKLLIDLSTSWITLPNIQEKYGIPFQDHCFLLSTGSLSF